MFKKTLYSITIVLIIAVLPLCVVAEQTYSVNLFGGVHFGMTSNEVAYELQQKGYDVSHFSNDRADCWIVSSVEVGGFKGAQVNYYYNVLDQLDTVEYSFNFYKMQDSAKMKSDFDMIEESLVKKYGETDYTASTGRLLLLNNKVVNEEWKYWSDGEGHWEKCEPVDYSERIVEYGDGTYMLIEHTSYKDQYNFSSEPTLKHMLCYTHYKEDLSQKQSDDSKENLTQEEKMAQDF